LIIMAAAINVTQIFKSFDGDGDNYDNDDIDHDDEVGDDIDVMQMCVAPRSSNDAICRLCPAHPSHPCAAPTHMTLIPIHRKNEWKNVVIGR